MSDFQLHAFLRGVLIPAVVTGLAYVLARLTPTISRDSVRAAGLAAAVALSYVLLLGMPDWPFLGSPKGVIAALILASLWTVIEGMGSRQLWWRRFIATGLISYICLQPLINGAWSMSTTAQIILGLASLTTLIWFIIDRGSQQMQPSATLTGLLVLAATSAAYIGFTGSASLAQVAGALSAGLGAAAVLSLLNVMKAHQELNSAAVLTLLGLWCAHAFYVDLNWTDLLWFVGPIFWFMLRDILGWTSGTPIKDAVITGLVSAAPAAYGLWFIYQKSIEVPLG